MAKNVWITPTDGKIDFHNSTDTLVSTIEEYSDGIQLRGSGSNIFQISGSEGILFQITDSLTGSLFVINDIGGIPVMEIFDDNRGVRITANMSVTGSVVANDDIEVTTSAKGLILTDGTDRWRVTVNTSGTLVTTKL